MADERSASGRPIYRHEQAAPAGVSGGDPDLVAAVDAHVTSHFGPPATTWHEIVSPYVHVDVHVVEPTGERPGFTLVTSGMSEQPMSSPSGDLFAELMMVLPATWAKPDSQEFREPRGHWPYKLLQDLARLPHEYGTWLWSGHTVPNGDPPEPYADDTKLCGALLAPPVIAPDGFERMSFKGHEVHFFAVLPLHVDEMQLKLDNGPDALYDLLDEADVTEILQSDRRSVVPKKRRLFGR
jgi:Suppressor of fused protein (SUFU)